MSRFFNEPPSFISKTATSIKNPITNNIDFIAGVPTDPLKVRTINKHKPWDSNIPVYNRDTSYGRSHNPDFGEHDRAKRVKKCLELQNPKTLHLGHDSHKSQVLSFSSSTKNLTRDVDNIVSTVLMKPNSVMLRPNYVKPLDISANF